MRSITASVYTNGLHLLLANPDSLKRLREQPQLIGTAVEECLRFESSNQLGNRLVVEPVTVRDVTLEPGTYLTVCIGAANRDSEEFNNPDRLRARFRGFRSMPASVS
jgi:cytochrome P450